MQSLVELERVQNLLVNQDFVVVVALLCLSRISYSALDGQFPRLVREVV